MNKLITAEAYVILQYGSSLFGSETKDSDYDIIIVTTVTVLSERISTQEDMRTAFLFVEVVEMLQKLNTLESLKVYDVRHARVPIVKLKYKDTLSLDVSLGIVDNKQLHGLQVT